MTPINHLYWRAGFGLSPEEWQEKKDWPVEKAVNQLFARAKTNSTLDLPERMVQRRLKELSREEREALREQQRQQLIQVNADWVRRMADPESSALLERMSLFWHGHFACRSRGGYLAAQQINTIRKHALGNFRDLLLGIARDPAMIRYLNNQQNRKEQANENFARELMELFTLGWDHYTEQDVKEAARAFTGWSSNLVGDFVFRRPWHDYGSKSFFGKKGNWNGEDVIDMILEKEACADFITRKIYRYFVNQRVDENRVQRLAKAFYQSNYDIAALMRTIFTSPWFYAPENWGTKVKGPVELLAGMIKNFGLEFENDTPILFLQRALGQQLFNPPNVAGWPGGKNWIDNASLMLRLNLPQGVVGTAQLNLRTKANTQPLYQMISRIPGTDPLPALAEYLLLVKPKINTGLIKTFSPSQNPQEQVVQQALRLMSLPEYQLC